MFLRERQVFPLRFIDSVAELKKKYDGFARKDALHVDRAIVSRLYDLYMLTGGDRKALQGGKGDVCHRPSQLRGSSGN